jgi:protein-L-isoaspartate(D-aspartate) O-methyltransferase
MRREISSRRLFTPLILACLMGAGCVRASEVTGLRDWSSERNKMINTLKPYGIREPAVLRAMETVKRHEYIPQSHRHLADPYGDHPCPIGYGQTISQPYIVAYMTERIAPKAGEKILEIGTGSGYQAAVLAEMSAEVYSIEIIPELAAHARNVLAAEGYDKVHVLAGDGYKGWPEHAPYDAIIVTCAPGEIPPVLVDQLRDGGRMILPLGTGLQRLVILQKREGRVEVINDLPVRFVPMVHEK